MRHTLPGQLELPQTSEDVAGMLQRKANETLRPTKPQIPADVGLFSDDSLQTDLIEILTNTWG